MLEETKTNIHKEEASIDKEEQKAPVFDDESKLVSEDVCYECRKAPSPPAFSSFYLSFERARDFVLQSAGVDGLKNIPVLKRISTTEVVQARDDMLKIYKDSMEAIETQISVLRTVTGRINTISEERKAYLSVIHNAKIYLKTIAKEEEQLKTRMKELRVDKVHGELKRLYVDPRHLRDRGYVKCHHSSTFFASHEESRDSLLEVDKFLKFNVPINLHQ